MEGNGERVKTDAQEGSDKDAATEWKERGNEYFRVGHYEEAKRCYSEAIHVCTDWDILYTNLANVCNKLGEFEESLKHCDEAERLNKTNVKALLQKGKALVALKRPSEALEVYHNILEIEPEKKTFLQEYISLAEATSDGDCKMAGKLSSFIEKSDITYKRGDVIMSSLPCVHVLYDHQLRNRCEECMERSPSLMKCSACKVIRYCSEQCQKQAWKLHKIECRLIRATLPDVPDADTRLLFRLTLKYISGRVVEKTDETTTFRKTCLNDLMSNTDFIQRDPAKMQVFQRCYRILEDASRNLEKYELPNSDIMLDLFGKIDTNSFTIHDGLFFKIGAGVYIGPSIFDHSCSPNAFYTFDGKNMEVRALTDFQGIENTRIMYCDPMQPYQMRQKCLEAEYYFTCACERCLQKDSEEHLICCASKTCDGSVPVATGICNQCHRQRAFDEEAVESFRLSALEVLENAESLKKMRVYHHLSTKMIEEKFLSKENCLHRLDIYNAKMAYQIFSNLLQADRLQEGVKWAKKTRLKGIVCHFFGHNSPFYGEFLLQIADCLSKGNDFKSTLEYAYEGCDIFHSLGLNPKKLGNMRQIFANTKISNQFSALKRPR